MSFFDEIRQNLSIDKLPEKPDFKAEIIGDYGCYLVNVKGIKHYSVTRVDVMIKGGQVTIKGESLQIKKYCLGDLVICGKITSLERE